MAEAGWLDKIGATPGKLVLIAGLAVVLVAAIVLQIGGDSSTPVSTVRPRPVRRSVRQPAAKDQQPPQPPVTETAKRWPTYTLESVIQHDPFAVSPPFRFPDPIPTVKAGNGEIVVDEAAVRRREIVSKLVLEGIDVIVVSDNKVAAVIGARQVEVGDVLEGFVVVHIDKNGVVLADQESY